MLLHFYSGRFKTDVMEFQTRFISREDRRVSRQSLTGKHGFKAELEVRGDKVLAALTDFSSLGFAITLAPDAAEQFAVGDMISVLVSPLINLQYQVKGVLIDKRETKQGVVKLSAVIEHEQISRHGEYEPIHLNLEQSIKGQLVHPFLYKQNSYFELESLSRNGFYATNINSDFTLFNNMELTYSLGDVKGLQDVKGRVSNVSLTNENKIRCFIETPILPLATQEALSQHCFHFAQKTPRDLQRAGLMASHIQELVQYRFVETQAEYEAVLKLRRKFYARQDMCHKDEPIARFALPQDAYGRILIVFHNERVIGSALLVFGERGIKPFELDSLAPASQLASLPDYEQRMEITEICIERHYQETDVLHGVFEMMYREGLSAGKNYIVVSSYPDWVERYRQMGFVQTNISFSHSRKNDITMFVMKLDKETGKVGKGMSPLLWWRVWGHVSLYLYERRIIEYSAWQKLRVYSKRALFQLNQTIKRILPFWPWQ